MTVGLRVLLVAGLFGLSLAVDVSRAQAPVASSPREVGSPDRAETQKRVLVLHSAREGQPSFVAFERALESALTEALGGRLDLYRESLDAGRFGLTDEYLATFRTFLRDKYKDRPDVVVALALAGVGFMDRYGEELFPHTPVLFVATRETRPAYGTSVFSDTDWNGSVGLALGLQPRTKHVFVVTGASQYDRTSLAGARVQFQALEKRLDFTYLTGLPIVELKRTVATLPPDSIIYFVSMTLDGTGRRFEGTTALEQIAAAANAPTYVQSETDLGRGAIGGHVWSSRPWGLKSAEIVLRLLAGEAPDAIPTSKVEIYRNQLDWRQLQRWKIDESLVPAGAQILFRELSIWDQYGTYIVGTIALVVFQLTLIGRLLVQRAYRRRIEASLRQSEQRFRLTAEQNQELVGRLINAQETERARVARDLHDDVSQQLASLSITLSALKRSVGKPHSQPEIEQTIITLQDRTAAAAESIRTLSHELHPSVLQHAGLVPTLRRHCADVGRQHRLTVTFSADDPPGRLSPDLALCLFRVAQEALANAVRHAQPRTIAVQLLVKNDGIELSVADDGIGFVASGTSMGLGLRSINERVRLMGGSVSVDSRPGHGTSVLVWIPSSHSISFPES